MILNSGNIWKTIAGEQAEFAFLRDRREEVDTEAFKSVKAAIVAYVTDEMEAIGETARAGEAVELMLKHIAVWQKNRKSQKTKALSDDDLEAYLT